MLSFGPSQRYFLYRHPTDMRKSFDGLSGLVRKELGRDPTSGDVFIFLNRLQTHIKLLVWDRSGFALYYKRLEEGTFERPTGPDSGTLAWRDLVLLRPDVSVEAARYRKREARTGNIKPTAVGRRIIVA